MAIVREPDGALLETDDPRRILEDFDRVAAERQAQPGLFEECAPQQARSQISNRPFHGMRFGIAKPDKRSANGYRYVHFCATEAERDALLMAAREIKGSRATAAYRVTDFSGED